MIEILFATDKEKLIPVDKPVLASGDVKTVSITVEFDGSWDGYGKSAVFFRKGEPDVYEAVMQEGNTCEVPHEVLDKPGFIIIGVRGVKDDKVYTSTLVSYKVENGAPEGTGESVPPTPDVYQQILSNYGNAIQAINQEKSDREKAIAKEVADREKAIAKEVADRTSAVAGVDSKVDDLKSTVPFAFGIDANSNYGYIPVGGTNVVPFGSASGSIEIQSVELDHQEKGPAEIVAGKDGTAKIKLILRRTTDASVEAATYTIKKNDEIVKSETISGGHATYNRDIEVEVVSTDKLIFSCSESAYLYLFAAMYVDTGDLGQGGEPVYNEVLTRLGEVSQEAKDASDTANGFQGELTELKGDLDTMFKNRVDETFSLKPGRISTSGNINEALTNYCYCPTYFKYKDILVTLGTDAYKYRIALYDENKTISSDMVLDVNGALKTIINENRYSYFRVCVSSSDGSDILPTEFEKIANLISIYTRTDAHGYNPVEGLSADSTVVNNILRCTTKSNILNLKPHSFNVDTYGSNIQISISNGYVELNGNVGSSDIRVKLTNGYDYSYDTMPWGDETVDFLSVGKKYNAYSQLVSGTQSSDGAILSFRNSDGISVLSEPKGTVLIEQEIAFGMFFIPNNTSYDNALYALVCCESERIDYGEANSLKIDENSLFPNINAFYNVAEYFDETVIHNDNLDNYGAVQGLCSDGENLYYSVWRNNDLSNTLLRKYNIASDTVTLSVENHSYGHANGMCYLPDGTLLICNMDESGTVSKVNATTLEFIEEISLDDILSPVVPWWIGVGAVAYDTKREKIVFLLRGNEEPDGRTRKGFAIFDSSFRFEKIIRTEYIESDTYSGLCTDDDFIYLSVSNPTHQSRGEWIIMYDWHGTEVSRIQVRTAHHLEAQALVNNVFYCADNVNYLGASILKCVPIANKKVSIIETLLKYNLNY